MPQKRLMLPTSNGRFRGERGRSCDGAHAWRPPQRRLGKSGPRSVMACADRAKRTETHNRNQFEPKQCVDRFWGA